jgi:hypothetical protein
VPDRGGGDEAEEEEGERGSHGWLAVR